jgi:hypothetical protein
MIEVFIFVSPYVGKNLKIKLLETSGLKGDVIGNFMWHLIRPTKEEINQLMQAG